MNVREFSAWYGRECFWIMSLMVPRINTSLLSTHFWCGERISILLHFFWMNLWACVTEFKLFPASGSLLVACWVLRTNIPKCGLRFEVKEWLCNLVTFSWICQRRHDFCTVRERVECPVTAAWSMNVFLLLSFVLWSLQSLHALSFYVCLYFTVVFYFFMLKC